MLRGHNILKDKHVIDLLISNNLDHVGLGNESFYMQSFALCYVRYFHCAMLGIDSDDQTYYYKCDIDKRDNTFY